VIKSYRGANVLGELDTAVLWSACEMWELYRQVMDKAKLDPINADNRIAVTAYWQKFEVAASRLGLNPSDRQRLKPKGKTQTGGIKARVRA